MRWHELKTGDIALRVNEPLGWSSVVIKLERDGPEDVWICFYSDDDLHRLSRQTISSEIDEHDHVVIVRDGEIFG